MGEQQGHEFRGNQYSGGGGGEKAGKVDKEKFQSAHKAATSGTSHTGLEKIGRGDLVIKTKNLDDVQVKAAIGTAEKLQREEKTREPLGRMVGGVRILPDGARHSRDYKEKREVSNPRKHWTEYTPGTRARNEAYKRQGGK